MEGKLTGWYGTRAMLGAQRPNVSLILVLKVLLGNRPLGENFFTLLYVS